MKLLKEQCIELLFVRVIPKDSGKNDSNVNDNNTQWIYVLLLRGFSPY